MKAQQQEKEFIALVEEYKQVIYKVCYIYASDPENLNDLYQEVVINLWKAFPRFRGECKASTWVYRIGLNTCISFFRKSKSKPEVVPISVDLEDFVEEDNSSIEQELTVKIVRACTDPALAGRKELSGDGGYYRTFP